MVRQQRRNTHALFFSAPWCAVCEAMKPMIKRLQSQGYAIQILNFDLNRVQVSRHKVKSVPTTIVFDQRGEVKRWTEKVSETELLRYLTKNVPEYTI